jgi:hypothetical protein
LNPALVKELEHDVTRKPGSTFRRHALARFGPATARRFLTFTKKSSGPIRQGPPRRARPKALVSAAFPRARHLEKAKIAQQ